MKNQKTTTLTFMGLMTAIMCIVGPLSLAIPVSPVPISFTNLAIYLAIILLGRKKATISTLVYLLMGLIGLPVFSGFTAGPGKLLGPTGGYLIGFLFMALIGGYFVDKYKTKFFMQVFALTLATMATYILGTLWLAYQANLSFKAALFAGVIPYIIGDGIKIGIALALGNSVKDRLEVFDL